MAEQVLVEGKFKKSTKAPFVVSIIEACAGLVYIAISIVTEMYWFLIATAVFELIALTTFLMAKYVMPKRKAFFELVVTESRVTGKLGKKRVDLPVSQISSIGTLAFNGIFINTNSGQIAFQELTNRDEVYDCLAELIKNRQEPHTSVTTAPSGLTDELTELKKLFDAGIITQEEFDAKKKQLLGL